MELTVKFVTNVSAPVISKSVLRPWTESVLNSVRTFRWE